MIYNPSMSYKKGMRKFRVSISKAERATKYEKDKLPVGSFYVSVKDKTIRTAKPESIVEYRPVKSMWKGKVVKGRKVTPPSFSVGSTIDTITNKLWDKYGYLTALLSINGERVRLSRI